VLTWDDTRVATLVAPPESTPAPKPLSAAALPPNIPEPLPLLSALTLARLSLDALLQRLLLTSTRQLPAAGDGRGEVTGGEGVNTRCVAPAPVLAGPSWPVADWGRPVNKALHARPLPGRPSRVPPGDICFARYPDAK
jgi:hypothetical protein